MAQFNIPAKFLDAVGGDEILAHILVKRGISVDELDGFLNPDLYLPADPYEFPGIGRAADIVQQALDRGEKICVYGDYDVDGVTATALLVSVLKLLGASVVYKVPDRFNEGYGLNKEVMKNFPAEGISLILTCDCGIANVEEIALARELGLKVVITDHHMPPPELPDAHGIVHPQMLPEGHRAKDIPGVAVAYFLAKVLLDRYHRGDEAEQFLDLVALGVVADVVPLRGENRYFVQKGLQQIRRGDRPGVVALMEAANVDPAYLTEEDIGFQLCPRVNAAGRMANARYAVELLLSDDPAEARRWAGLLNELNQQRRQIGDQMLAEAEALLDGREEGPIVLFQPHWHHGIIGITAGRLCEKYQVPVILMSQKEDGVTVVGSARSVEGIHIFQVLEECAGYLERFGGHAGAAGVSLKRDKLTVFAKVCERILADRLKSIKKDDGVVYDLEIPIGKASKDLFEKLRILAPFGEGWPQPLFYCRDIAVLSARPTTDKKHLRLVLQHQDRSLPAIYWWAGDVPKAERVDLLYYITLNRWRGEEKVQLVVNKLLEPAVAPGVEKRQRRILQVLDYRRWRELGQKPPQFTDAVYFYEGAALQDFPYQLSDRYTVTRGKYLVLLTCPPSSQILRELIALTGADTLILAYSSPKAVSLANCIKLVMSYIKHVVNRSGGRTTVFELARITGQTELLMMGVIRFLRDSGFLEVEIQAYGQLLVKMLREGSSPNKPPAMLKDLLEETNAYRRYMSQVEPGSLVID